MVDLDRTSQSPFVMFTPEKNHADSKVLEAQLRMENNLLDQINIEDMANEAGVSIRQLNRRFKAATGVTVNNYLQLVRVDAAKTSLVNTALSIEEISLNTGYENISFFRRLFKKQTSLTPSEYRKRFR